MKSKEDIEKYADHFASSVEDTGTDATYYLKKGMKKGYIAGATDAALIQEQYEVLRNMDRKLRPVKISGDNYFKRGFFHSWTASGDAIIESDDGQITTEKAYLIQFTDRYEEYLVKARAYATEQMRRKGSL